MEIARKQGEARDVSSVENGLQGITESITEKPQKQARKESSVPDRI